MCGYVHVAILTVSIRMYVHTYVLHISPPTHICRAKCKIQHCSDVQIRDFADYLIS